MICVNDNAPCYNSVDLTGMDYKCTSENPICVKVDGSEPALHSAGDKCEAVCYNSANLPSVDNNCTAEKQICVKADGSEPASDSPGDKCVNAMAFCYNSANSTDLDYKCTAEESICVMANGSEPALYKPGDKCEAVCYNSANLPNVDNKCTAEKLMCVKADGSEPEIDSPGDKCIIATAFCYNSANSTYLDYKCTAEYPICIKADGSEPTLYSPGDQCEAACYNSANLPNVDNRCTAEKQICAKADGSEPASNSPGDKCINATAPCYNSVADAMGVDYKCTAAESICVMANGSEPALHKPGDKCEAVCYNSANIPNVDNKCTVEQALCIKADGSEPAIDSPGDRCVDPWHTYSTNDDFDNLNTTLVNVNTHTADQLDLESSRITSDFLWVPESDQGSVVKINTKTGVVVGRYRTWPQSIAAKGNPQGLSVDIDGSLWVGNSRDYNGHGTITHIGLEENGQCEDRNGNGAIDTSISLNDTKAWASDTGTRGVATADDECIVHFVSVTCSVVNHVTVNQQNDVWVSGSTRRNFDLVKGGRYDVANSGTVTTTYPSVGWGGYAGLIDRNGFVWSSVSGTGLMRWDADQPLSGANGAPGGLDVGPLFSGRTWAGNGDKNSYAFCLDSLGNVWNTLYQSAGQIRKYSSDGKYLNTFNTSGSFSMSCVGDPVTGDVWIIQHGSNTVGHHKNDGTLLGTLNVGTRPIGIAIDRSGKIWVSNRDSQNLMRIDPALNGGVGGVDLTVTISPNAYPHTLFDMTGSTLTGRPSTGTWAVTHDSGVIGQKWGYVKWTASIPSNAAITVQARSSTDGITYSAWEWVSKLVDMTVSDGRYLQVRVTFTRATTGETPILHDLSIVGAV